jgi:anti-sigma factor RsiW
MSSVLHRARFKLDHRWAPGHMSAYLDDELALRRRVRMERHTGECAECRGVLHSLRRMLSRLQGLPQASASPEPQAIAAAVRARLHEPSGG